MFSKSRAGYIDNRSTALTRTSRNPLVTVLSLFLAFAFLATTLSNAVLPQAANVAHADDPEDILRDVISDSGISANEEGFADMLSQVQAGPDVEETPFVYLFHRFFSVGYMNNTEDGVAASPYEARDWNCSVDDPLAGTPLYHNCDVPNIITEFMQNIADYLPSGPRNATSENAKVPWGIGLPSTIPGTIGVPVDPSERTLKYTGLELFGYSMKYSSYAGEWDHIKVMTTARALSNFGFMDNLRLGAATVINGVVTGIGAGANNFVQGISQGNLFGAVGGFFTGFFSGAFAGGVKTIADTSDMNVFNTYAWYRVNYGATVYGGRELSQKEIGALMLAQMEGLFSDGASVEDLPPDYLEIQEGPEEPLQPISRCIAQREDLREDGTPFYVDVEITSTAPGGISEADCISEALILYDDPSPTWSADGNQQLETLAEWRTRNQSVFSTASTFGLTCEIDTTTEEDRDNRLAAFYACWTTEWDNLATQVLKDAQTDANQSWYERLIGSESIFGFFSSDPQRNFNAPWSRFVCTDENGDDVGTGLLPMFVYNPDGTVNSHPDCEPLRPPIQNGFFGNGYPAGAQPLPDTRAEMRPDWGVASLLLNPTVWIDPSLLANAGLGFAKFTTQLSNELIDLAFNPILQTLGLDTKIVTWIEAFRDSIYFPLVFLLVALAGLQILWNAGRHRQYSKSFIDIILVMGTYVVGAALLLAPTAALKAVDTIPSRVETAVLGSIFMAGTGDDGLCDASQEGTPAEGLDGSSLNYSPAAAVRILECEVWRTFAFNPWVKGQFGVGYDKLYSENSGQTYTLNNSNTSLVGDAEVYMGAGRSINNWAVYQLDVLSVGTSTTVDTTEDTGVIPRDFYRIVDAQAGPNNGALSDGTYLEAWSGKDAGGRTVVGLFSGVVGLFGLIAIFIFAIVKIEITLFTALLLLFMPIIFLIGLHPSTGRLKLRQYIGTIVALMFQRVVLVMLLAVMLKVLTAISLSSTDYWISGWFSLVICVLFIKLRKPIFRLLNSSVGQGSGGLFAQEHLDDYGKSLRASTVPLSVRNQAQLARSGLTGTVGGYVGGYIHGGIRGARQAAEQAREINRNRTMSGLRRKGLSDLMRVREATQAGVNAAGGNPKELRARKAGNTASKVSQELTTKRKNERTGAKNTDLKDTRRELNKTVQRDDIERQVAEYQGKEWDESTGSYDLNLDELYPTPDDLRASRLADETGDTAWSEDDTQATERLGQTAEDWRTLSAALYLAAENVSNYPEVFEEEGLDEHFSSRGEAAYAYENAARRAGEAANAYELQETYQEVDRAAGSDQIVLNMKDPATRKTISRISEISDQIAEKDQEYRAISKNFEEKRTRRGNIKDRDFDEVKEEHAALMAQRKEVEEEIKALEQEKESLEVRLYARYNKDRSYEEIQQEYNSSRQSSEYKTTLTNMFNVIHQKWETDFNKFTDARLEQRFAPLEDEKEWEAPDEGIPLAWIGWMRTNDPTNKTLESRVKDEDEGQHAEEFYQEYRKIVERDNVENGRFDPEPEHDAWIARFESFRTTYNPDEVSGMTDSERYRYELDLMKQDLSDAREASAEAARATAQAGYRKYKDDVEPFIQEKASKAGKATAKAGKKYVVDPVSKEVKERVVDPFKADYDRLIAPTVKEIDTLTKPVQEVAGKAGRVVGKAGKEAAKATGHVTAEAARKGKAKYDEAKEERRNRPKWGDGDKANQEYEAWKKTLRSDDE